MNFLEIDGSEGEGGGQILRTAVSLSCIFGLPTRITKIRAGRPSPGLRPQHLASVISAAEISNSVARFAEVGSTIIELVPGDPPSSISKRIDVGTAGSVSLVAQTLIPIAIFRNIELDLEIVGGTEVPQSPTIDYLQKLVLPLYGMMGGRVQIEIIRRGYYPRGGGCIKVRVNKTGKGPLPLKLEQSETAPGTGPSIIATSCSLPDNISRRELDSARSVLEKEGIVPNECVCDSSGRSLSPGTSVLVFRQNEREFIGASSLGEIGKRAELVGAGAAQEFLKETRGRPNFDSHISDMVVTLASCIPGRTTFTTSKVTRHLETNLWVAKKMTGMTYTLREISENKLFLIELLGSSKALGLSYK